MIDKFRPDLMEALDVVSVRGLDRRRRLRQLRTAGRPARRPLRAGPPGPARHTSTTSATTSPASAGSLHEGRLRRVTASFPILQEFYDEYFAGKVELELIPQGTLRRAAARRRLRDPGVLHAVGRRDDARRRHLHPALRPPTAGSPSTYPPRSTG